MFKNAKNYMFNIDEVQENYPTALVLYQNQKQQLNLVQT